VAVADGLLTLAPTGQLLFDLENADVTNRILGTADAELDGKLKIDAAAVTDSSGSWNLVDVATLNETFGPNFGLQFVGGLPFGNNGAGVYRSGRWTFTTADGNLTLSAVPEPASSHLFLVGFIAARIASRPSALHRRHQRRRAARS